VQLNLRKTQNKISILDDGDMRLDQVKIIARRIEPSLDDPCAAVCIIDRAPKPRAADGTLFEVS
jgi:hypothetical protein